MILFMKFEVMMGNETEVAIHFGIEGGGDPGGLDLVGSTGVGVVGEINSNDDLKIRKNYSE
jgi:hypothetical protein